LLVTTDTGADIRHPTCPRITPMLAHLPLKSALGAATLAAVGLMLTPAAASAQAYSYQGNTRGYGDNHSSPSYGYQQRSGYGYAQQSDYGYDQSRYGSDRSYGQSYDRSGQATCRSDRRQRQGTGAVVGASFGAVVGSQLGARGRRTEGSVLGALIGGALGAAVGSDSARDCNNGQARYGYDDRGYSDRGYSNQNYGDRARHGYEDRGYSSQGEQHGYQNRGYSDDRAYPYSSNAGYRSDCRPVAVRSRDSRGRTVTRYQPSC